MIETVIHEAHKAGKKVGFCGQAPSNDPGYAQRLVGFGIDSISVTPDSFVQVLRNVAKAEES
jgi:pyruvate,water dikinase